MACRFPEPHLPHRHQHKRRPPGLDPGRRIPHAQPGTKPGIVQGKSSSPAGLLVLVGLLVLAGLLAPDPAQAQSITVDLGEGGTVTGQIIRLVLLVTVLSLAPSILVMVTSFTRVVIVLSFLRTALGLQQTPPNAVLVSLALFLTLFIMAPTMERAWNDGIAPLIEEEIDEMAAFERASAPFRDFYAGAGA